jgi:hypothetical protein
MEAPVDQMTVDATGGGAATSEVHTQGTIVESAGDRASVKKVFVAVHGVGDQYTYATIQSVVNQVCTYYDRPAAVPLGSFHTGDNPFSLVPPYERDPFEQFSFAEVYWAEIPRTLVKDKHKLEETKQWARTLVERLRLRWKQRGYSDRCRDEDFALIGQVLSEMIQTVAVLDRLTFLASRAGLFSFDLKPLLDDYVGDVQIVAEFASERKAILAAFESIMTRVHRDFPQADIHVVAHSEGTVVAFLGLIKAFRDPSRPSWAKRVRGLMTIGSPIDKHLLLWPSLFATGNAAADAPAWTPDQPIAWRNYYDHGDPVGFELNDARVWLHDNGWDGERQVFEFGNEHDIGFSRYPLPGAAHVAYWKDPAVFGHFIATVVNKGEKNPPKAQKYQTPPGSIWWKQAVSYVLPYAAVTALLAVAAYVLFRSLLGVVDPEDTNRDSFGDIARSVLGMTAIMLGITIAARVPRLTRDPFWRVGALAAGVLGGGLYWWFVSADVLGRQILQGVGVPLIAALLILVVYGLGMWFPSWGIAPLVVLGTVAAAGVSGYYIAKVNEPGPLWPLVLAILGYLYLWWVAALFFDLAFVWHRYIRYSKALAMMDYVLGGKAPPTIGRGRESTPAEGARHLQVS